MAAPAALGVRRRCLSCMAAFYDLGRTQIFCPKCGVEFKVVELPRKPEPYKKYGAPFPRVIKPEPDEAAAVADDSDETLLPDEDDETPPAEEDSDTTPE
jgi:hypothetical protein